MRRVLKIFQVALFMFVVLIPALAFATVDPVAYTGKTLLSTLLNQFEDAGNRLIQQGEDSGNAVVVSAGNQVRVAIQNADVALKDRSKQVFDDLTPEAQSFFVSLNQIISNTQGSIDRAVSVAELFNMNLIELTNRLPFTKKTDFYIDKISGITQTYHDSNYQITIRGLGFGQDTQSKKYTINVKIGDTVVPGSYMERTPPYDLRISLPKAFLEPKFQERNMASIPMNVTITAEGKKRFLLRKKTSTMTWPLKLVLMPKQAGTISGTEIIVGKALDGITKTTSVSVEMQGCKPDRPCDWSRTIPLASNERVVGVRWACTGQCRWCYPLRQGHGYPDYDILEGGTKVVVYQHCDGENPTNVTHYVDYQTMTDVPQEKPLGPIPFQFNTPFSIKLASDNVSCSYRLNASFVTRQNTYIDNGMVRSPDNLLLTLSAGRGPAGTACTPTFIANVP